MNASTVQDMWNTRPVRRHTGRTVAGVCVGAGERYRVDPTLIKVAFVVATLFGGSGILLYIAAVIAMPSDSVPGTEPHRPGGEGKHLKWIPLVIGGVIAMAVIGSPDGWGTSGILGALLMAGGWYLLHQRTPVAPAGTSAADLARPDAQPYTVPGAVDVHPGGDGAQPADTVTLTKDAPGEDEPPTWDPLGAARFAWDLPEPTAPAQPPAPRVPRSPVTPIVLGLAVMTGAATSAAAIAGVTWLTPGRIASLVLAVLGAGLIVAALQRRPVGHGGSGLVPLAMLGAVVVVALTSTVGAGSPVPAGGVGDRTWAPTTPGELKDEYSLTVGTSKLDLRDLSGLDRDRTVTIRQGVGDVRVLLPDDIRVITDCSVGVGETSCTDGVVNPDAKTPTLTIDAHLNVGNVEMIR